MRRRDFMTVLAGAAAYPTLAGAQQKAMPVIGFLGSALSGPYAPFVAAFRQGLGETGYVEGQNVAIEYRWAEGSYDRLPALATDLVRRKVDLIAASGGNVSALAAKNATSTIPIVFFTGGDPVGDGLVGSLARPGGNITGVTFMFAELTPKRLELVSELVPQARVIALLTNPNSPGTERMIQDVQEAARVRGLQVSILEASPKRRSTPPSPPSFNCELARSSSALTHSSSAGASNSWRWHHVTPFQGCISTPSSPLSAD